MASKDSLKEPNDAKVLSILSIIFGFIGSIAAPICAIISICSNKRKISYIVMSCIGIILFIVWMIAILINL